MYVIHVQQKGCEHKVQLHASEFLVFFYGVSSDSWKRYNFKP